MSTQKLSVQFNGFIFEGSEEGIVLTTKSGKVLRVSNDDQVEIVSANGAPKTETAIARAMEAAEVGQKLKNGLRCFMIEHGAPVFVADKVIAGPYSWYEQGKGAEQFNGAAVHGRTDWQPITDKQLEELCLKDVWKEVAPDRAIGSEDAPLLWSPLDTNYSGVARRPGIVGECTEHRDGRLGVVPVCRGPARS